MVSPHHLLEVLRAVRQVQQGQVAARLPRGRRGRSGAADAVRNLPGVTNITNLIELRPRVSSIDVKKHIEDSLKRNAELEAKSIRVNVAGNKVTLEGNVKAWHERRIAEQAAWATPGVTTVDDRLSIG